MTRVVLDVNVLVSGLVGSERADSVPGELFRRWEEGDLRLVISQHLRDRVAQVLERRYFRERVKPEQQQRFATLLAERTEWTAITRPVDGVAPDQEDDLVVATALSARARYLVTGDADLRRLGLYEGVEFLTPREFLTYLEASPPSVEMSS